MKTTISRLYFSIAATLLLLFTASYAKAQGAVTPFTSYEAEAGTIGGGAKIVSLTTAPTTQYSSPELEASGHSYVQLTAPGQFVQWTNKTGQPISFINLRESIPDAPTGGGITATLDLYVDGVFRQALNLNSRQSWLYEGNGNYQGNDQNPADGNPRVFFDESHTFITGAPIAPGSTFSVRVDASNTASFYYIDVIDVENPPRPITQPANSISIESCGAVSDNTPPNGAADPAAVDSTAAIQDCINQAQTQGKILWIPQGTYYLIGTQGLNATGITIEGAGMWYSTIYRSIPLPNNTPLAAAFSVTSCTMENLHIESNAMSRTEVDGGGGAMDTTGTNWLADSMWNQHVESGCWASGTGGTVKNSRFTSEWADGCNINNVSLNATVGNNLTETNNFFRGTGDDGLAINSVAYNTNSDGSTTTLTPMSNATVTNNTIIAPWGGKGVALYGGSGHHVENNYVSDTARFIGLGIGRFGVNGSDLHTSTVTGNVVVRSGGNAYNQGQPALQIGNGGDGQDVGIVDGMTVTENTIVDSVYDGVGFSTSTNTALSNNTITSPWRNGIVIDPPYYPAPTGSATITGNTVTGVSACFTPFLNNSSGFTATLSGNSWPATTPEGPYCGTPAAIPGTVLAENYDLGGQGVGYNVTSINGSANGYRADGVDLESTSAPGGGDDLGWTTSGQWFRYTVNVAAAATYNVTFVVASPSGVTDGIHIADSSGNNLSGPVNITATGGWETWTQVTASVTLPAGVQTLTFYQDNGGFNFYSASFAAKPPLTVTVHGGWRTYGAANPAFTYTVTGLSGSDTVTVTPQTTATAASPVGSYPVTATVTGSNTANYSITVIGATLTVNKALLHIQAKNIASIYGDTPPQPTAYDLQGFVNGDTASVVSGAPILSATATSASPAGFYPIQIQLGTLSAANYAFTNIDNGEGSLGISKRPLQAIANNLTMTEGGPVPTLTYHLSGFVNGDTATTAVSGAPAMFTTATPGSTPGQYLISGNTGTLSSQNYAFERVTGTMTVVP